MSLAKFRKVFKGPKPPLTAQPKSDTINTSHKKTNQGDNNDNPNQ
jgi:hypothetical protein